MLDNGLMLFSLLCSADGHDELRLANRSLVEALRLTSGTTLAVH